MSPSRHVHERLQYATAPGILVDEVDRNVDGVYIPFDAESEGGWNLFFRMWTYVPPGRCGGITVVVADAAATQPAIRQMLYMPVAADVIAPGEFRGVFWARRISDLKVDVWPVQTIRIAEVLGGAP